MTFSWYYLYSPKYEIFHHILNSCIGNSTEFLVFPVFAPQEAFQNTYSSEKKHFFSGNVLKCELIVEALRANPGKHVLCSDVDIIVNQPEQFSKYLEQYSKYDITFMKDNVYNNELNIGFGMLRSCPEVIHYFEKIMKEIHDTNGQDQEIFNRRIGEFTGTVGCFSMPEVIQSNLANKSTPFFVLQMLCSNKTYEENLFEKLITATVLIDISELFPLIPFRVFNTLVQHYQNKNPSHYFAKQAIRYE